MEAIFLFTFKDKNLACFWHLLITFNVRDISLGNKWQMSGLNFTLKVPKWLCFCSNEDTSEKLRAISIPVFGWKAESLPGFLGFRFNIYSIYY